MKLNKNQKRCHGFYSLAYCVTSDAKVAAHDECNRIGLYKYEYVRNFGGKADRVKWEIINITKIYET